MLCKSSSEIHMCTIHGLLAFDTMY